MSKPIEIPQHVDDPLHFLFWTIDEVAPIGLGLFIGNFLGQMPLYLLLGFIASKVYSRFKSSQAEGLAYHFLYWHGFTGTKSYASPNPFTRSFYP